MNIISSQKLKFCLLRYDMNIAKTLCGGNPSFGFKCSYFDAFCILISQVEQVGQFELFLDAKLISGVIIYCAYLFQPFRLMISLSPTISSCFLRAILHSTPHSFWLYYNYTRKRKVTGQNCKQRITKKETTAVTVCNTKSSELLNKSLTHIHHVHIIIKNTTKLTHSSLFKLFLFVCLFVLVWFFLTINGNLSVRTD